MFQDWQRTQTQSSVTAPRGPRQRMDVRFCEGRNHRREAQLRAADAGECGCARSSEARVRRTAFPLDKDLHGRRPTRKLSRNGFGGDVVSGCQQGGNLGAYLLKANFWPVWLCVQPPVCPSSDHEGQSWRRAEIHRTFRAIDFISMTVVFPFPLTLQASGGAIDTCRNSASVCRLPDMPVPFSFVRNPYPIAVARLVLDD